MKNSYGKKMRILRAVRGITQRKLQELTGIPNTYLSDYETGKSIPSKERDILIREALNWPENETVFVGLDNV